MEDHDQVPIDFDYLAKHRRLLKEFCTFHATGLIPFYDEPSGVFKLNTGEDPVTSKHITSTATCFASLEVCPQAEGEVSGLDFRKFGAAFATTAIQDDLKKWRSDGKAEVYCSCRGLPYVLSKLDIWHENIDKHLWRIAYQLREQSSRFAIGEAVPPENEKDKKREIDGWYEPNAYHTYWTLELLSELKETRFSNEASKSEEYKFLQSRVPQFELWARQQLGLQVALHSGKSSKLDSDQLAWSLAIMVREPREYQSDLAAQDIIRESLHCLFKTQEPVGTWRHYSPLFHYPNAGNAYCYVFETFAVLLQHALRPGAEFLRTVLKGHAENLISLWKYADSTKAKIPDHPRVADGSYGWTSGHRIRPDIESWATASVYAYAEMLRRLIGIWTSKEALAGLNHKRSTKSQQEALRTLNARSRTWTKPDLPDILASIFINPLQPDRNAATIDPDRTLISEQSARSMILFGPPGTGKTTLIGGLADAIGWKYIELHPSHFVSEGLPSVQSTADGIFSKLMELDHAVILFDEIDELVRERELEADQFGRFLTTSMLPRLAELWKARKVIYFVATNHIEFFDRAITRSERFDAVVFLSPPTFEAKKRELLKILKHDYSIEASFDDTITQKAINDNLPKSNCDSLSQEENESRRRRLAQGALPKKSMLSKFALVRWDELNEIALNLARLLAPGDLIKQSSLEKSLEQMNDTKTRGLAEYCRFISDPESYERFDASRVGLWRVLEVEDLDLLSLNPLPKPFEKRGDIVFARAPIGHHTNVCFPGYDVILHSSDSAEPILGSVMLRKEKRKLVKLGSDLPDRAPRILDRTSLARASDATRNRVKRKVRRK